MILKKPYAMLIKHFKLIHLLLSVPLLYLLFKTGDIAKFFSTYITNDYSTSVVGIAANYISYFMYLAIIIVILASLAIYFLMKQKEKNSNFYVLLVVFYMALFILVSVAYSALSAVEDASVSAQTVRVYRDISYILYIPQFFFLGFTLLRGTGFNLKQFNFDIDMRELEISDVDDEEFEIEFGKDIYKYKRQARRLVREFSYYFLENKVVFLGVAGLVVVTIGTLLYLNFNVYHKSYRQTQKVSHNGLIFRVVDSELSNMDMGGRIIQDGKYFMAVALTVQNNGINDVIIDYQNFKLVYGKEYIVPTLDRGSYFTDLGIPYTRDMKIKAKDSGTYVLVYEVPTKAINKKLELRVLESLESTIAGITPVYKKINLNYKVVKDTKDVREYDTGKILELSDTRLGLTQVQFKDLSINTSYLYDYEKCNGSSCNKLKGLVTIDPIKYGSNKVLLVVSKNITVDTTALYFKNNNGVNNFIRDFFKIRYEDDNGRHEEGLVNITPSELSNNLVLVVPDTVKNAKRVDLLLDLRGSVYVMNLKK